MSVRRRLHFALLFAPVMSFGCSTSGSDVWQGSFGPSGTGEVHGTFAGHALQVKSVTGARIAYTDGTSELIILMSDYPDLCAHLEGGHQPPNARVLDLDIVDAGTGTFHAPNGPGSFDVVPFSQTPPVGADAIVTFYSVNSSCGGVSNPATEAVAGDLDLTLASASFWEGRASVETSLGESDEFTFHASSCSAQAIYDWVSEALPCQ